MRIITLNLDDFGGLVKIVVDSESDELRILRFFNSAVNASWTAMIELDRKAEQYAIEQAQSAQHYEQELDI